MKHYKHGYFVSKKGKVVRVRDGKKQKVKIFTNQNGYDYFHDFVDKSNNYVHRAVAKLFLPQSTRDRYQVDHIDRNRQNNNVSNLRWVNRSENLSNRNNWIWERPATSG